MKSGLISLLQKTFGAEPKLHPIDRRMAKQWIKQRLVAVFPELRNNPRALEESYRALSLEPRAGTEQGDADTYYQIITSDPRE